MTTNYPRYKVRLVSGIIDFGRQLTSRIPDTRENQQLPTGAHGALSFLTDKASAAWDSANYYVDRLVRTNCSGEVFSLQASSADQIMKTVSHITVAVECAQKVRWLIIAHHLRADAQKQRRQLGQAKDSQLPVNEGTLGNYCDVMELDQYSGHRDLVKVWLKLDKLMANVVRELQDFRASRFWSGEEDFEMKRHFLVLAEHLADIAIKFSSERPGDSYRAWVAQWTESRRQVRRKLVTVITDSE